MSGEELMRTIMAALAKSDLRPLLNALHDDVVWKSATKQEGLFRFKGEYMNRSGVIEVLSNISVDYTFSSIEPKEILAVGDVIWGYFDVKLRHNARENVPEPKNVQLDMAIRWRLRDGKIIEHHAFFDTAYLLMEQLKLQL